LVHYRRFALGSCVNYAAAAAAVSDLLSTLVVVLARQNLQSAEMEASFMWGLVEPSLLVGDWRYFLMTLSSAVDRLKTMRQCIDNMSLRHRAVRIDTPDYRPIDRIDPSTYSEYSREYRHSLDLSQPLDLCLRAYAAIDTAGPIHRHCHTICRKIHRIITIKPKLRCRKIIL